MPFMPFIPYSLLPCIPSSICHFPSLAVSLHQISNHDPPHTSNDTQHFVSHPLFTPMNPETLHRATELAHRFIILDGHIDLPWRLSLLHFTPTKEFLQLPVQSTEGDFDYMRAKTGGLSAAFMAIYIPATFQNDLAAAKTEADTLIDLVNSITEAHPDKFAKALTPDMIEANFKNNLLSLPLGLENGAPITTFEDLDYFFNRGIRYITLTHAKDNHICDSSYDPSATWKGVSPFGKQLIRKMNDTGMMIDVSHISDKAFYQVMELSRTPVIASHSSCRTFTPGWERNMSDDMIKLLAEKNGIIQINFGSDFLDADIAAKRAKRRKELQSLLHAAGMKSTDPEAKHLMDQFNTKHPDYYSDIQKVADHFDHARNIAGIDHIGIGSDFDGLGDSLPVGLKDVSMFPNLIAELLERDYTEEDIEKICYINFRRVWLDILNRATA